MPSVTLLLPTFNPDPRHLREAVGSVLAQTLMDWELFIHDDASEVDVKAMVAPFLKDPRVHFSKSAKRLGIGGNWNACAKLGSAPFVQYLFQDDRWEKDLLQKAVNAFKSDASVGFVVAHHRYDFEGHTEPERMENYRALEARRSQELKAGKQDGKAFLKRWIEHGLRPNLIGEPSFVMLRRSLMERVGPFRKDLPQGLDVEYWIRCLARADFVFLPEVLGTFRVHPKGASARNDAAGFGLFDRLACYETLLKVLPRGELRTLTKQSLIEQFSLMAAKFLGRVQKGKKVNAEGSKALVRMMLRHPLLTIKGVLGKPKTIHE